VAKAGGNDDAFATRGVADVNFLALTGHGQDCDGEHERKGRGDPAE
jgi:hypothetical protein